MLFSFRRGPLEIQDMVKLDMDATSKLSVPERLALLGKIWDSISAEPASMPVSDAQLAEALARIKEREYAELVRMARPVG
jgi:putative addiction module component (TIGR02574 family)